LAQIELPSLLPVLHSPPWSHLSSNLPGTLSEQDQPPHYYEFTYMEHGISAGVSTLFRRAPTTSPLRFAAGWVIAL